MCFLCSFWNTSGASAIRIDCSPALSVPQNMKLPFSDAVTIIGNLLDNGIHATLEHRKRNSPDTSEKSVISLSVVWQQGNLFLHMSNPCSTVTVPEYGIGMKNVEEIVKKYSGTMQTRVQNGNYITDIILYFISVSNDKTKQSANLRVHERELYRD